MGLGKTLQAISIAYYYKDAWPLLIVVPSSVKFSWIDEIEKWLPEFEPHDLNLIRSGCDISNLGKAMIHVVGYGLLSVATSKLLLEALENHKLNIVILDESHYLKNRQSVRTKHLLQICKKAKHAILLSGTPSLARPRELFPQLNIVCPGKFGSFSHFVKRYCDARDVFFRGKRGYDTSGASNLDELYHLLKTHVMIRRLKKEVLTQLPPKRRQKVIFDISESNSKYNTELKQIMKDFRKCSAIINGSIADDQSIESPLTEIRRLSTLVYHYTGLVKIGPVLKYIEDLAQGMDGKFIVFFRHRLVRQAIEAKLVALKLKYICIAGDVPSGIRGELVHSFQTDTQVRVAALSIEAASFGLTLTAAHHVVFAELHHTPGVIIQAEDRAHRIGQTLPVNIHYLIAKGTVDEILWSLIRRKVYVTTTTLDGKCKDLETEDADEDLGRKLSACAAWIQEQEEGAEDLEDFVIEQLTSKAGKKDQGQRDLRSFFVATPVSSKSTSFENSACSHYTTVPIDKNAKLGVTRKTAGDPIYVLDKEEDGLSTWDGLKNDAPISAVPDFVQIPEEKPLKKDTKSCAESRENCENLRTDFKPGKEALKEKGCPLKLKTLKFKKGRHGKLSFAEGKTNTKQCQQKTNCNSLLNSFGNDPETESQTLRGYLDNEDEPEITNLEDSQNIREKYDCLGGGLKARDREFFTYLQEADIECVEVVCKRTSRLLQDRQGGFNDSTTERMKHKIGRTVNDSQNSFVTSQGSKGGSPSRDSGELDMLDPPKGTSDVVNGDTDGLRDKIGKLQNRQVTDSCTNSCGLYVEEIGNKSDIDSAEKRKMPSPSDQGRQSLENGSSYFNIVSLEDGATAIEGVLCERSNNLRYGTRLNQPSKESLRRARGDVFNPPENSSRDHENKECLPIKEDENASITAVPYDDDSSDDFQDIEFKNTQVANLLVAQRPTKKRKATNKSKQKTANRGAKTCNKDKQPPADWPCGACTFINDGQLLECSICFTPRANIDETTSTVDNEDLCIKSIGGQGYDDVCISDKMDQYEAGVDCTDTSSTSVDRGRTNGVVKHESSQISFGSAQMTFPISTGQTEEPHASEKTIVHNLSSEWMITLPNDSRTDSKSSIRGANLAVRDSASSHVAAPGLPPWSCSACTFLNLFEMIECSVCLTPKRRSRRVSAKKNLLTVETGKEVNACEMTLSGKRRRKGNKNVKDHNPQDMDVEAGTEARSARLEECINNTTAQRDRDISLAGDEGLTPEPLGSSPVTDSSSHTQYGHEIFREEIPGEVTSNPRKRLKLDEVEGESSIRVVSYDSEIVCSNSTIKCSYAMSSPVSSYELMAATPPDDKGVDVVRPLNCVLSSDEEELELRNDHKSRNCKIENSDLEMDCEQLDVSDHSVTEQCSGVSSTVSSYGKRGGHLPSSQKSEIIKVMEELEELKAAAEELFNSEWEDDERWWEEESSFGESSFASSSETVSSSPTVTRPGFTKCSELCSVTELKKKLEADTKQLNDTRRPKTVHKPQSAKGIPESKEATPLANDHTLRPELDPGGEEEKEDEEDAPPEAMKLKFCLSRYTERLYLYSQDGLPLGINFCMSDVKNCNMEDLPAILLHEENLTQIKRFLEKWRRVGEGKKRILRKSGLVFDDPLEAYECARKGMSRTSSYVRHPSKETQIQAVHNTAEEVGGKVRVVKKPQVVENKRKKTDHAKNKTDGAEEAECPVPTSRTQVCASNRISEDKTYTYHQAVTADGIPLCLSCKGPVEFVETLRCSDWDTRFCSHDCKQEYQVRGSGTTARRALFEAERGICQLCSMDAHNLYQNVVALPVRDRPKFLAQTPYSALPNQTLKKMIMEPKEGMFWEADHITPVSEGGGECGLDNLRTLCVICHRKATTELNKRLKQRRVLEQVAGYADISTFFHPLT
ncbi:DNA annealing helicase and endonuclease ZRANB3 [Stylophora pistillata]|uniref:DNA annealing helicase and endonuclease ZRANB3 n=2 Tax=Stylophora pistillata TaxID=50429 RepID=A0A2B4RHH8_STYPI|nr:DNA annealing helicase and endonuclease ZRANB3 [Stylophora pistillata]